MVFTLHPLAHLDSFHVDGLPIVVFLFIAALVVLILALRMPRFPDYQQNDDSTEHDSWR